MATAKGRLRSSLLLALVVALWSCGKADVKKAPGQVVAKVNGEEADEYQAFLTAYNAYWRTFFDPISVRIKVSPEQFRGETIILPLIDNSIYTGLATALGGTARPRQSAHCNNCRSHPELHPRRY